MGELAALAAAAVWAFASILWTRLGERTEAVVLNLLKCAVATVMLSATLLVLEGSAWPAGIAPMDLFWLTMSGLVGLSIGDSAYFHALTRIGPRRALLMWAMAPAVSALLAWPVLGEPIHLRMVVGMVLTLGGVVWVVLERQRPKQPGPGADGAANRPGFTRRELTGFAFAAVALCGQGSANVLVKLGGEHTGALGVSVVRLATGALGLGIWLGATGRLAGVLPPLRRPHTLGWILLATLVGTFAGIWLASYSILHAEVGVAATLTATSPLFILPLAVLMQGERVSLRAVAGALVAVAGVAVFFLA
jgi:drug/metabolite transporter (DMT)-like permease